MELLTEMDEEFLNVFKELPKELIEFEGLNNLDPLSLSKKFFNSVDISSSTIDPNGSVNGKSPMAYTVEVTKPIFKFLAYHLMWTHLLKLYGKEKAITVLTSIIEGGLYFHDTTHINKYYCVSFQTGTVLCGGMPFLNLPSSPPKSLSCFISQVRQATQLLSGDYAGAIGLSDLITGMAFFSKNISDYDIINAIQDLTHSLNLSFRVTNDPSFTNVMTMDRYVFEEMFKDSVYPDYSKITDNFEEVNRIQKLFLEFYVKGSPITGLPYGFPVVTYCYSVDENDMIQDNEMFDYVSELNSDNCVINFHQGKKCSSCCRMSSDVSKLKERVRFDSFGNGGLSVGSSRVVTINLHRMMLIAQRDDRDISDVLNEYLEQALMALMAHRDILLKREKQGLFQFFNNKWFTSKMFFNTFGYIGMYEAFTLSNEFNIEEYIAFSSKIIGQFEYFASIAGTIYGDNAFNVEEIPGENAASVLAKKDNILFNTELVLLSNQTIPLVKEVEMSDRLKISGIISNMVSGGSILHLNINNNATKGAIKDLTRLLAEKYKIQHFALNKVFSICRYNHANMGEDITHCSKCGEPIVDYVTRVVGYFSKVSNWSPKRREVDFPKRQWYMFASDESNCGKQDNNNHDEIDSETSSDTNN